MNIKKYIYSVLPVLLVVILTLPANAQEVWQLQDSNTNRHLRGIHFTDINTGWAVGDEGLVIKTTNGGVTWKDQATKITNHLNDVIFINTNNGWVVGNNGTISKSVDGGTTWSKQISSSTKQLLRLQFIDSNNGWVVGKDGTVLKTVDGGDIWTIVKSKTTRNLNNIYFVDSNNGWVIGDYGTVLKTTDGGTTWTTQTSNTNKHLTKIIFIDSNTGWIVGNNGLILKTTDGGTAWETKSSNTDKNLNGVSFVDTNTGWVIGNEGLILKTTDGGLNWTKESSQTVNHLNDINFSGLNNGWIAGNNGVILKTKTPYLKLSLIASPGAGTNPLSVSFTGQVEGNTSGNIVYKFDCTNDGSFDYTSAPTTQKSFTANNICSYSSTGNYTAKAVAERDGLTAETTVTIVVVQRTFTTDITFTPNNGIAPLNNVSMTAVANGNATGEITYQIDCTNDGIFEQNLTTVQNNFTASNVCNYENEGIYTVKIVAQRQGITAETTSLVTVVSPSTVLSVSLTATPNSGIIPLNVGFDAIISGTATGESVLKLDCTNDGTFDYTSASTAATIFNLPNICDYATPGTYTAKTEVIRKIDTSETSESITAVATAEIKALAEPLRFVLSTDLVPKAIVGEAYQTAMNVTGGTGTKTFSLSSGRLPLGLMVSSDGLISGTPTENGTFHLVIAVTDGQTTATREINFLVSKPTPPEIPPENITTSGYVPPTETGSAILINQDNTTIQTTVPIGALTQEQTSGYHVVVNSINEINTEFVPVPSTTGELVNEIIYDIKVVDDSTAQEIKIFNQPIIIEMSYTESDLPSGTNENEIVINFFNETTQQWEALPTTVDTINNIARATVNHFTRFALVAAGIHIIPQQPQIPTTGMGGGTYTPPPVTCENKTADFNKDGKVDLVDFSILSFWYKKQNPPTNIDLDCSNKVDLSEFSILIYYWTR